MNTAPASFKRTRTVSSAINNRPLTQTTPTPTLPMSAVYRTPVGSTALKTGSRQLELDCAAATPPQQFRIYSCQRPFGIRNLQPNRFKAKPDPIDDLHKLYDQENRKFIEDFLKDRPRTAWPNQQPHHQNSPQRV